MDRGTLISCTFSLLQRVRWCEDVVVCSYSPSSMRCEYVVWCSYLPSFVCYDHVVWRASRVQVTVCSTIFDDLFWWKAPQTRESNQIMTEDAAHQTKGKERDWMEDEVMNLKRTEESRTRWRFRVCAIPSNAQKEVRRARHVVGGTQSRKNSLSVLFGERHSFPSNIMCCVCGGVLVFPELLVCAQTMLVCRRGIRGTRRLERGNSISMDMETDTMGCEKIPNGVRDVTKMSKHVDRLVQSRQKLSLRLNVQDSWDSQARLRTS